MYLNARYSTSYALFPPNPNQMGDARDEELALLKVLPMTRRDLGFVIPAPVFELVSGAPNPDL
jgi:hypothetical protein